MNWLTLRGHTSRPKRSLAMALAVSLLVPSVATALLPAAAWAQAPSTVADLAAIQMPTAPMSAGPIHTILMFPFANAIPASAPANGFDGTIVGARVENAIKLRLNTIGRYKANSFSPTLPQIQRAVQDSGIAGITETDVAPPYDSAQKGRKIADQVATDGFLLGTIESIDANTQTRTVSLTITATLYNTTTGQAVKALAYTGRGISYNASDDPATLLQSAINDASGHVVSALNADVTQGRRVSAPDERIASHHGSSSIGKIAVALLLAAAVAIGITAAHHSHSSSSPTTTTPTGGGTPVGSGSPPAAPF